MSKFSAEKSVSSRFKRPSNILVLGANNSYLSARMLDSLRPLLPWDYSLVTLRMNRLLSSLSDPSTMATITIPSSQGSTASEDLLEIDLKEPWLAAILAWMLPGLGHLYQGRTGKGILFFVCILGTFFYGLYLGKGNVVYASVPWEQQFRWQYLCQLGVGLPSTPMLLQRSKALKDANYHGFMAPPRRGPFDTTDDSGNGSRQPSELAKWTVDTHPYFELGTVYTVVAGLLNVLAICDAAAGPLLIVSPPEKKKNKETTDEKSA